MILQQTILKKVTQLLRKKHKKISVPDCTFAFPSRPEKKRVRSVQHRCSPIRSPLLNRDSPSPLPKAQAIYLLQLPSYIHIVSTFSFVSSIFSSSPSNFHYLIRTTAFGESTETPPRVNYFFSSPPPPTAKRKGITMFIAWKLTTPTMQSNGQMVQEDKRQQITIVPVKRPRGAQSYPALLNNRYLAPKLCISFAHFPHSKIKQSKPLYSGKKIVFSISISFLQKKNAAVGYEIEDNNCQH